MYDIEQYYNAKTVSEAVYASERTSGCKDHIRRK